ncbi:DUF6458 family protein [Nocardioides campestrisoli]|uniref:DUF6458 family protein n=1 Tax=Nocardioides campestrisoli TaxID=2736757 RepID=UPI0015E7541C|nr:DUF6458 family protein [Nocardioides campestrisoli]
MEDVMGYGGAVGLIVVGLILSLAVSEEQVGPVNLGTVGWILTLAGVGLLILSLVQQNTRRRQSTVATTTDAQGRQATTQRTVEADPPPPAV